MIDYEFLRGRQNEFVVSDAASEKFRFRSSIIGDHASFEKDLHWTDGHIKYREIHTVIKKAVAGFAHL